MPIEAVPGTSLTYYLVAFDALGNERDEGGALISRRILEAFSGEPISDVFLISHGWQGDIPAARRQYGRWLGAMAASQADIAHMHELRPGFHPLLIGLHWPSLPWGDEELGGDAVSFDATAIAPAEQLIDAYASRIADTLAARTALQTIFQAALRDIAPSRLSLEVGEAYEVLNREAWKAKVLHRVPIASRSIPSVSFKPPRRSRSALAVALVSAEFWRRCEPSRSGR